MLSVVGTIDIRKGIILVTTKVSTGLNVPFSDSYGAVPDFDLKSLRGYSNWERFFPQFSSINATGCISPNKSPCAKLTSGRGRSWDPTYYESDGSTGADAVHALRGDCQIVYIVEDVFRTRWRVIVLGSGVRSWAQVTLLIPRLTVTKRT